MDSILNTYRKLVDDLRETRRRLSLEERNNPRVLSIMDELESMYDQLSYEEQKIVSTEYWMGWPDLYDRAMENSRPKPEPAVFRKLLN